MSKNYIGLDPGKSGGFVRISDEGVEACPTPTIGDEISLSGVKDWLVSCLASTGRENILVGIEDVHSIFGSSAGSNFQFGRALGMLEGCVAALEIPFVKVAPKTWQKVAHVGIPVIRKPGKDGKLGGVDTKAMAALAAERLYPGLDLRGSDRAKKAHDGIVDALLIAHYLKTQNL